MMNKRGSVFFGVAIGITVWILSILFLPFLMDDVTTFRDAMNCSESTDLTGGEMMSCIIGDAAIPYIIFFFASLAIGFIIGAKT